MIDVGHSEPAEQAAQILKDIGYGFDIIVGVLFSAFNIGWEAATSIVTEIFGG